MPEFLGLSALGWPVMLTHWWNKLLAGVFFGTLLLGLFYAFYALFQAFRDYRRKRSKVPVVPKIIQQYVQDGKDQIPHVFNIETNQTKPKSFGVFLGSFEEPATKTEQEILSSWDLIVVDPAQNGVFSALLSNSPMYALGRMDMELITSSGNTHSPEDMRDSLEKVIQALIWRFTRPHSTRSPFTGILLANWRTYVTTAVCNELIRILSDSGLEVYLELSEPDFLTIEECRYLDLDSVSGVICRNGTIRSNGDRRDYFQMSTMRRALRAFAAHSQMSKGNVLMWDAIDDDAPFDHAVVIRSLNWCNFYSALSWIGRQSALTHLPSVRKYTIWGQPLGALAFIKDDKVVKLQDKWRSNQKIRTEPCDHNTAFDSLSPLIANLSSKLALRSGPSSHQTSRSLTTLPGVRRSAATVGSKRNPLAVSAQGSSYTGLGCFQIGLECNHQDFDQLVVAQRRLLGLNLLQSPKPDKLRLIVEQLRVLISVDGPLQGSPHICRDVEELVRLLDESQESQESEKASLRVYMGMHSGFRTSLENRFWGLYDFEGTGKINLYISLKAPHVAGAILHTFLSSRQHSRVECLLAEVALAVTDGTLSTDWGLPASFVSDIEGLTPTELLLLARISTPGDCPECPLLAEKIKACCEFQLLENPSLEQLRQLNSTDYLSGHASASQVVNSRLLWYSEQGAHFVDPAAAACVFDEINHRLPLILFARQIDTLDHIQTTLEHILYQDNLDAAADLLCLSLFCALRKLAINEIYLEVLDRNPLPNPQPDQSACFAEMFALGSRCQAFFDVTPNVFGRILAEKNRIYYNAHQPPPRDETSTELPTSYASKQVDLNPDGGEEVVPLYYKLTFLGIFAFPALIDITLLTTIGRGLYLSSYMSQDEKAMATTALMVALFLTGAIGTWISSGGSYYLFAMAFPTMNIFVLTRWVAGVAICICAGTVGFVVIAAIKGAYAALIFFVYLFILTTYLITLASLAIYQLPGYLFQSGRMTVMCCIPILFISPILTLWINNDIIVYLCVLTAFLVALVSGAVKVASRWTTWYIDIPFVSDSEITKWYLETTDTADLPAGVVDISITPIPRIAFAAAVEKERLRSFWSKPTKDAFVLRAVRGYSPTMFLMSWYCKYSRTQMPFPYTTTWNLQCRAAIDTLKSMQKGLKLHNAFIHWRHSGAEVYCGVLYFIVALMDKWVALITGGSIVGLSAADSADFRLPVGFALVYYLVSAICLDAVAQPLWPIANRLDPITISSLENLNEVKQQHRASRRKAYWSNLGKFFLMHIWALSVSAAILWAFSSNRDATIMYLGYMGAYTGLLWYQYSRIFTGTDALPSLIFAACAGLTVGPVLQHFEPTLFMNGVIALATATWTVALLSLRVAGIGWSIRSPTKWSLTKDTSTYNSGNALRLHVNYSQTVLSSIFGKLKNLPEGEKMTLDPASQPGSVVLAILQSAQNRSLDWEIQAALPTAKSLITQVIDKWHNGEIVVELVSHKGNSSQNRKIQYVSQYDGNRLHVFILSGQASRATIYSLDVTRRCRRLAETVLQAVAETYSGLPSDQSSLVHLLVSSSDSGSIRYLSETARYELDTSPEDCVLLSESADAKMLQYALLGIDCDRYWDTLPRTARDGLLRRCFGEIGDLTKDAVSWATEELFQGDPAQLDHHVRRCDLRVKVLRSNLIHAESRILQRRPQSSASSVLDFAENQISEIDFQPASTIASAPQERYQHVKRLVPNPILRLYHGIRMSMKFFILSIVADPEFQKELDYFLSKTNFLIRWPIKLVLNGTWIFCKTLQDVIIPIVVINGREHIAKLHKNMKGGSVTLKTDRVLVEKGDGDSTYFFGDRRASTIELRQYTGLLSTEPETNAKLVSINSYNKNMALCRKQKFSNGTLVGEYIYSYSPAAEKQFRRLPVNRTCISGTSVDQSIDYDARGFIKSGSYRDHGNIVEFKYGFRAQAKYDEELIHAEYTLDHITIKINWCVPSSKRPEAFDQAIPNARVTEAWFMEGENHYHTRWVYDHKVDPELKTTLNGVEVDTPDMITNDWFKILKRPVDCSFAHDDPLLAFASVKPSLFSQLFGGNVRRSPKSTANARNLLWKSWKSSKDIDAVTARYLDEWALRSDMILRPYWNARDIGRLSLAEAFLDNHQDTVMAKVDIDPEVGAWTQFAIKTSDLYAFGTGGDTAINTRSVSTQIEDKVNRLHVLTMDTGTWPNEGGGVSACRRDMVNDLTTIRWHIIAECANDYGFPKFQAERNVQSLVVLPLWGLDYLTPSHGVFQGITDSQIQEKSHNTSNKDIKKRFLPILRSLVKCARAIKLDHSHIEEGTKALLDLNKYFESSRHWSDIWMSDVVKDEWRVLWLCEDMENARPISEWMNVEHPTLSHLDNALDMWQRYLFIFSLPVPEKIPDVFQASHHFAGASYGIICKIKRGCSFHVWDHCISWREVTVFLSSAMSFDPPFVGTALMNLSRILSVLTLHHADVVLPCCDYFNPGWEVELGSIENTICHRKTYARKIDPVVNGICNMESFKPVEKITSTKPTAVMLSHVRFVKDIKNAVLATDIIVNIWGLKDYRLDIYGDMERAPAYATECQEIIAAKGLRDHVNLRGLGSPSKVLQDAWLFLNSSVSEGLPLAMGEAALSGVPVVCTDVGASFRVVTDQETGKAFSAVCPPNDSYALAKAQISIMGLLGEWAEFADDPPGFVPPEIGLEVTAEQSEAIAARMYEKAEQRRRLGMRGRANVLSEFSSDRYLREHEQMLWLAKHQSRNFQQGHSALRSASVSDVGLYVEKSKNASYVWSTD